MARSLVMHGGQNTCRPQLAIRCICPEEGDPTSNFLVVTCQER